MAIVRSALVVGADVTSGTTMTTSVTVGAGSDGLLLAFVHLEAENVGADHVTSVVWNGTALTELDKTWGANWSEVQCFYLKNPTPATGNLVTTITGATQGPGRHVAAVFTGVDQTTTFRATQKTAQGHSASATSSTLTVPAAASGDYLIDALTVDATGHALTVGANQTEEWDDPAATNCDTGGSSQAGADGGVMSWTWTTSAPFSHIAVGLIPASGAAAPTVKALSALGVG